MHLHTESSGETVWAVIVGAILATLGGFIATQLEAHMRRRENERSAALLFGEILSALETITAIAGEARLRGDPYGRVTLRLIRAAQRETQTYERNRASLYDLREAEIRIRIHVLMVQVVLALEGVLEASEQISLNEARLEEVGLDPGHAETARSAIEVLIKERETAFQYTMTTSGEIKSLVSSLRPLAKVDFEALKKFSGNPFVD